MGSYYKEEDLSKFSTISDWHPELGKKFFDYYEHALAGDTLSVKEKSIIALAVSHALKCPYCIDAYTTKCFKLGVNKKQMAESIHVASSLVAGITLVHGVQMMNKVEQLSLF